VVRVGLTGGLASGKSLVASWFAEAGFQVIDADRVVAGLYRPGEPGVEVVRRLFGEEAIDAAGGVDHARVAERVFAEASARRALEAAIHPLVAARFEAMSTEAAQGVTGVIVFEATLLVESGLHRGLDLVVTVEADPERRVARAVARGMAEASARGRLAAQGDGAARRAAADRILDNDDGLGALRAQVDRLIAELRERARS
jgi:dephospho-CoA kinase